MIEDVLKKINDIEDKVLNQEYQGNVDYIYLDFKEIKDELIAIQVMIHDSIEGKKNGSS